MKHDEIRHLQVHVEREQMPCHLTKTTPETHRLIEENLGETPVYGGWVDSKGPRYCPSIEDKIVRFKDKESHQVGFLPPIFPQETFHKLCSLLLFQMYAFNSNAPRSSWISRA